MARTFATDFRAALISMVFFTVLCGAAYPLLMTGVAQAVFPGKAGGSIVESGGVAVGSSLVGQDFSAPKYFHPRPSATVDGGGNPQPYSGLSGGSNLGPSSQALIDRVKADLDKVRAENDLASNAPVPGDAVTTSASGLDPHISPAYADLQVARVARVRGMSKDAVRNLVQKYTNRPTLLFMGGDRVNVLLLNLALDRQK